MHGGVRLWKTHGGFFSPSRGEQKGAAVDNAVVSGVALEGLNIRGKFPIFIPTAALEGHHAHTADNFSAGVSFVSSENLRTSGRNPVPPDITFYLPANGSNNHLHKGNVTTARVGVGGGAICADVCVCACDTMAKSSLPRASLETNET